MRPIFGAYCIKRDDTASRRYSIIRAAKVSRSQSNLLSPPEETLTTPLSLSSDAIISIFSLMVPVHRSGIIIRFCKQWETHARGARMARAETDGQTDRQTNSGPIPGIFQLNRGCERAGTIGAATVGRSIKNNGTENYLQLFWSGRNNGAWRAPLRPDFMGAGFALQPRNRSCRRIHRPRRHRRRRGGHSCPVNSSHLPCV